ncbi:hypothetical protein M9434_002862 [Picochlorum sp. BPE23]|nr:hypothetical protein M9434_002862 [Picochlorum sp. BPE23]
MKREESDSIFDVPLVDENAYRHVQLSNDMQCLLVSDPLADKAAAACDVRVGSLSDPENVPGLAHFLEHMLFYSSAKYPVEDEYSKFISSKGGSTNAYTSNESTNFHFDVNCEWLEDALDRFAQFFIHPLISADGVLREAKAVDSEHEKNLNSDPWKQLQLWKLHSTGLMSRFSTGNYSTLVETQEEPRENVLGLYHEKYSANLMKVVIVSNHSLDELERMCKVFESVENKNLKQLQPPKDVLLPEHRGILIQHVPEKEGHTVEVQWMTLSEEEHYRKGPLSILSHLLGHEEKGTLFAILKEHGLANSLTAGEAGTSMSSVSFFSCKIELTDVGKEQIQLVLGLLFAQIDLIRHVFTHESENAERLWKENLQLALLRFNYREKLSPYSYATSLAHAMQIYELKDLLKSIYHVPLEYAPELVLAVLDDLTPEHARIMVASKSVENECNLEEEWYGTHYSVQKIPETWISEWKASSGSLITSYKMFIPEANSLIPTDFTLLDECMEVPKVISKNSSHTMYFRSDPTFKTPKAILYLGLYLPESYVSPLSATMTNLAVMIIEDALSEISYSAELAGLRYSLSATTKGIVLNFSGYHDKMSILVKTVLNALMGLNSISDDRFSFVKQKLKKEFSNLKFEQPYRLTLYEMDVALEHRKWHMKDYEAVVDKIDARMVEAFIPRLFSTCHTVGLCEGNLPESHCKTLITEAEMMIHDRYGTEAPVASQLVHPRVVCINSGSQDVHRIVARETGNPNSAIIACFQGGQPKSSVMLQLLAHIGKRDAFYHLRTVEQLGYIVFFTTYVIQTVTHLLILIQSSEYDAAYIDSKALAFLSILKESLSNMSAEDFDGAVAELIASKKEKPKRLAQKAAQHWYEIDKETFVFDRKEQEIDALSKLTMEEFQHFTEQCILDPNTRRLLRVQIQSNNSKNPTNEDAKDEALIEDIFEWKNKQSLLPSSIDDMKKSN